MCSFSLLYRAFASATLFQSYSICCHRCNPFSSLDLSFQGFCSHLQIMSITPSLPPSANNADVLYSGMKPAEKILGRLGRGRLGRHGGWDGGFAVNCVLDALDDLGGDGLGGAQDGGHDGGCAQDILQRRGTTSLEAVGTSTHKFSSCLLNKAETRFSSGGGRETGESGS
jgi:hypothetical protein